PAPVVRHELSVPVPVPDVTPLEPARPEPSATEGTPRSPVGDPDIVEKARAGDLPADPPPDQYVYTDELPQPVRCTKPVYPDLAREAGVDGTVKLKLLIGLDGHVLRAIVRAGGSIPMLDEAAIAAAMTCVFTPALANQRPVKVWVAQDYRF